MLTDPPEEEQAVDEGDVLVMCSPHFVVLPKGVSHQQQRQTSEYYLDDELRLTFNAQVAKDFHFVLRFLHYYQSIFYSK